MSRRRARSGLARVPLWVWIVLAYAFVPRTLHASGGTKPAGNRMTIEQLRELARSVGFPGASADIAAAVAMAESSGYEGAVGDEGHSFGLWQINKPAHPQYEPALLLTPWYNAQAALEVSKHGTDFNPWTCFRNGAYRKYMPTGV